MATSESITVVRERSRPRAIGSWRVLLAPLLIFIVALLPRAAAIGRFVTVDEAYHWFDRAEVFLRAVQHGDYRDTDLVGHPGVTTMWLGAGGVLVHRWLAELGWSSLADTQAHRAFERLPVALVTALCVALAYPLLRRLLDGPTALLATLLWATEPFLVAHSQLLHVDALVTSFVTLALLTAMLAFHMSDDTPEHTINWRMLVASGVASGLALLTKSPSISLLPMVGLIAVVGLIKNEIRRARETAPGKQFRLSSLVRQITSPLLVWFLVAAIVWVALWPAAWVELPRAVRDVFVQAESDGGSPHAWGNFFMGQAVADPGPLFYPVVTLLRMTPWMLIGLVAVAIALFRRTLAPSRSLVVALLAVFVLLFVIMMSIPPKKFDRYILPIFPALAVIAAVGLVWVWEVVSSWRTNKAEASVLRPLFFVPVAWAVIVFGLAANLFWYHPYEISYYNPLLGGATLATRVIPVGWGEGYEQVGAYISAQPDGSDKPVAAWFPPVLSPFVNVPVGPLRWALLPDKVDYAVLYIDQMQRNDEPEATTALLKQTPVYTVRIHGIDYAYVYRVPPSVARPLPADFGNAIHLRGYDVDTSALGASGSLTVTLQWQAREQIGTNYNLFVHVLDAQGKRIGQVDVSPGGEQAPTSSWNAGRYVTLTQRVPVQAKVAGAYWIAIGVYDPQTFARLPVRAEPQLGAPDDGADALLLGPITLP